MSDDPRVSVIRKYMQERINPHTGQRYGAGAEGPTVQTPRVVRVKRTIPSGKQRPRK